MHVTETSFILGKEKQEHVPAIYREWSTPHGYRSPKDVDFIKNELLKFYRVIRGGNEATAAVTRLRAALHRVEGSVDDSAQGTEQALPQRWGYVQLVSLIGTVKEERKGLRLHRQEQLTIVDSRVAAKS